MAASSRNPKKDDNKNSRLTRLAVCSLVLLFCGQIIAGREAIAAEDPFQASTSDASRATALHSIPMDQLDQAGRQKANYVLADVTAYRRMPIKVVDCDPALFTFMVENPDVVVDIWQTLKLSKVTIQPLPDGWFRVSDGSTSNAVFQYLYKGKNTHVIYGKGRYKASWMLTPVIARFLIVVRQAAVKEPNGRYYITCRMDGFMRMEPGTGELLTKTLHPMFGGVLDNNFSQVVGFFGSFSRTSEMNPAGIRGLTTKLSSIDEAQRSKLNELAGEIARRSRETAALLEPQHETATLTPSWRRE